MLAHGDKRISVGFKKSSLVTSGTMETGDAEQLEQSIRPWSLVMCYLQ